MLKSYELKRQQWGHMNSSESRNATPCAMPQSVRHYDGVCVKYECPLI